jgi:hypothetical protein
MTVCKSCCNVKYCTGAVPSLKLGHVWYSQSLAQTWQ